MFEIEIEEALRHIGHDLTFLETTNGIALLCKTCNYRIAEVDNPEWRVTYTIYATGYATVVATSEDDAIAKAECLSVPDDLDDIEYETSEIEAELS